MTEIGFYHLTRSSLEQALPKLLGRVLALPARALLLCPDPERLRALDAALWTCPDPDWLPHGTTDGPDQPIFLAGEDRPPPNGARHIFLVEGAQSAHLALFERGFDLFDGNDPAAVDAARRRWSAVKAEGHVPAYWQQGARGWERKA